MKRPNYGSYLEGIKTSLSSIRGDFWMWMALWYSQPNQVSVDNPANVIQSDLEFLFENPTGNKLDNIDLDRLYLDTDLDFDCDITLDDNFGYDNLHSDLDFDCDIW